MRVNVNKAQLNTFVKKARKSRNEIFAALVGDIKSVDEVDVYYFDYVKCKATPFHIIPDLGASRDVIETAKEAGLRVVGTIHSHPGAPAYMSTKDWQSHISEGDCVSGIVEICGGRTRTAFWEASCPVPCKLVLYK